MTEHDKEPISWPFKPEQIQQEETMTEQQFAQDLDCLVNQAFTDKVSAAVVLAELQAQSLAIQLSINRFILGDENAETE